MKFIYALPFFISAANAQDLNNINWRDFSSTPEVNQQVITQDFNFTEDNESNDFDFLNQVSDERVFTNFTAKVRILNKYTDKITDYTLKPNQILDLKKFKIQVKSCATEELNHVINQFAFIEVLRKDKIVFKGWMSDVNKTMSFPELNELYLNLISCDKDLSSESVEFETIKEISTPTELKIKFD